MGYWSNASEGFDYKERYCARCAHNQEDKPCAVLEAHMLYNYKEANKKGSILHILIPRTANGLANDECRMFWPRDLSLIHISEPTRLLSISYAVFCLKK